MVSDREKVTVLFVCLGNICRSPAAEGVLLHKLKEKGLDQSIQVESCGLGGWHVGELPDKRMQSAALLRGVALTSRAQKIHPKHFDDFRFILAADNDVLVDLHSMAPEVDHKAKIHLFTAFGSRYRGQEVPDPYYGTSADFEEVLDIIDDACDGLLVHISAQTKT